MNKLEFFFSKKIYTKSALIKSAYNFTDKAYIHLDENDESYIVSVIVKNGFSFCENDFENEMLSQLVRHEIYEQTKEIRKLTLARAFASTVIFDSDKSKNDNIDSDKFGEDILSDWFDKND